MDPLLNPFRPGAGASPPALVGRDPLINDFGVSMRRALKGRPGKGMILIGLRGVGKTVLLSRFRRIAEDEGLEVAAIEAPETGDFAVHLALMMRKALLKWAEGPVSKQVNRALKVLKSFTLTLPDGAAIRIDPQPIRGVADSGSLAEDVTDLLLAVGEAARERHTGLLIAIDELQYLDRDELAAIITALHRSVQEDLPVVLCGAGLPQVPALAGEAKSYSERLFEFPEVGPLPDVDAREALSAPACAEGVNISSPALDEMVIESGGYPYFIQEWGKSSWNVAHGSEIDVGDVSAARPLVREGLDRDFFRVRLDRLTPKERDYLLAMAELGPGPHRSGDIAFALGVKVESVAPRRSQLIRKGMIYSPAHGDTAFTVPLFDDFMRRLFSARNSD